MTTDAVAARARISKKTLYRVYENKDALMGAVLDAFVEGNLAEWDRILEGEAPAIERVAASLAFVADLMQRVQTRLIDQVERIAPALWERVEPARARRFGRLKDLLQEAQAQGFVRADMDLDLWLFLLLTTVRSAVNLQTMRKGGYRLPDLAKAIIKIYCEGLLTPKGLADLSGRGKGGT